jgi:hypothetical protein
MTTVTDLRMALASTIQAGVDISAFNTGLYTYGNVVESITLPAVVIEPASANFQETFNRGLDSFDFNLFVLVSRADPTSAQPLLDALISGDGASSIRLVIYNNPDLGIDGVNTVVHSMKGYGGSLEGFGLPHIGAVIQCCVYVSNS